MVSPNQVGRRTVEALGLGASQNLLDAISRPEADRSALIGRLSVREDAGWLAELLIDIETDELTRLSMIEALRGVLPPQ